MEPDPSCWVGTRGHLSYHLLCDCADTAAKWQEAIWCALFSDILAVWNRRKCPLIS